MSCCFPCFFVVPKEEAPGAAGGNASTKAKAKEAPVFPCTEPRPPKQPPSPPIKVAPPDASDKSKAKTSSDEKKETENAKDGGTTLPIAAQTFTFRELAAATKNFRSECLLGEGGFGRVYRGCLESTGQAVAVKQLDQNGLQGNREFLVEVLMLSLLHHTNLVNLIGYCADGDQRLLVYEYMSLGSLEDHLHDVPLGKEPLDWLTRMKIAAGAAKGLEYLHDKANPPVIYRDLKSSNILLDETFHPKLSDFGLAKLGPVGDKSHVSTRVMGTYGYCAPEYAMTGQLTVKSDVYSFGVVLLELITGRRAIDNSRSAREQNLVAWARPLFKDRKKFPQMADPRLQGRYPMRGLYQALAVAAMCLQEQAASRPVIGDVVTALSYLASQSYDPSRGTLITTTSTPTTPTPATYTLTPTTSTPTPISAKEKKERASDDDEDEAGHKLFRQGLLSPPHRKSPEKKHVKKACSDDDSERRDDRSGSNSNSNSNSSSAMTDRERAVAEARSWGEGWREKMRGGSTRAGFDPEAG